MMRWHPHWLCAENGAGNKGLTRASLAMEWGNRIQQASDNKNLRETNQTVNTKERATAIFLSNGSSILHDERADVKEIGLVATAPTSHVPLSSPLSFRASSHSFHAAVSKRKKAQKNTKV